MLRIPDDECFQIEKKNCGGELGYYSSPFVACASDTRDDGHASKEAESLVDEPREACAVGDPTVVRYSAEVVEAQGSYATVVDRDGTLVFDYA